MQTWVELLLSIEFSRVVEGSILSPRVEMGMIPQGKATEQLHRKHMWFVSPLQPYPSKPSRYLQLWHLQNSETSFPTDGVYHNPWMMGVDITAFYPSELSARLSRAALQMTVYAMTSLRMGMSVQSKIIMYLGNTDLLRDSWPLILSLTKGGYFPTVYFKWIYYCSLHRELFSLPGH